MSFTPNYTATDSLIAFPSVPLKGTLSDQGYPWTGSSVMERTAIGASDVSSGCGLADPNIASTDPLNPFPTLTTVDVAWNLGGRTDIVQAILGVLDDANLYVGVNFPTPGQYFWQINGGAATVLSGQPSAMQIDFTSPPTIIYRVKVGALWSVVATGTHTGASVQGLGVSVNATAFFIGQAGLSDVVQQVQRPSHAPLPLISPTGFNPPLLVQPPGDMYCRQINDLETGRYVTKTGEKIWAYQLNGGYCADWLFLAPGLMVDPSGPTTLNPVLGMRVYDAAIARPGMWVPGTNAQDPVEYHRGLPVWTQAGWIAGFVPWRGKQVNQAIVEIYTNGGATINAGSVLEFSYAAFQDIPINNGG